MRQLTTCLAVLAVVSGVHGSIFSVGHGGDVARNGKIKFKNVLADNDNSWNYQRSQFECSDAGFYYISFHGLARKNSALTLQLHHNNREIVRAYGDGTGYNTASNSAIVYLNNRDTIWLSVAKGNLHESDRPDRNFVTLSGYKIGSGDFGPQFGGGSGGSGGSGGAGSSGFAASPAGVPDSPPPSEGEEEFTPLGPDTAGPSK